MQVGIHRHRKINLIRSKPDGDKMALIWVFLLDLAGESNDRGRLVFSENVPYDIELLAEELNFSEKLLKKSLEIFEKFGMVFSEDGYYIINGWEEYQNTESLDRIRNQTKERVAKCRERKKQSNVTSNVTVTLCNATDKEEEKEYKNKNKREREEKSIIDLLRDV